MLKRSIKIAWRRLMNSKLTSLINIGGLALSVAVSLLLIQYVNWQWNFDRFHKQGEHIVRVQNDIYEGNQLKQQSALTYTGIPVLAKEQLPTVKNYVRLARWIANDVVFQQGEKVVRTRNFFFTDPSFFDVFSFQLLQGNPNTALIEPNSIVLTATWAEQLFGDENPIGKTVIFESRKPFTVTGVMENPPMQSHIQFEALSSLSTMQSWGLDVYGDTHLAYPYSYVYLQLKTNANSRAVAENLTNLVAQQKNTADGVQDVFQLQPLKNIHLYSDLHYEITANGKGNNVWILFGIAILILLLAWINHFNITAADVLEQQQSLSLRRIVGASKIHLLQQVATSAFLSSGIAIAIGMVIAQFSLPFIKVKYGFDFETIVPQNIDLQSPAFWLFAALVVGTLITSILPAYLGANTNLLALFQQSPRIGSTAIRLRSGLVVLQFAIIIGLLISGMVIYRQLDYIEKQDLGINLNKKIAILAPLGTSSYENMDVRLRQFKQEIAAIPGASTIAVSRHIPGDDLERLDLTLSNQKERSISLLRQVTDLNFFSLYQLPFLAKDTTNRTLVKSNQVIINKRAMQLMGFDSPQQALYKKVTYFKEEKEIIGVVENHHQRSLHYPTEPILYDIPAGEFATEDGYYSLQLTKNIKQQATLRAIQTAYKDAFPNTYFDFIDVEEQFAAQYATDQDFKRINQSLIGVSLMIAFIGLIGLFTVTLTKRIKEIGIRKVMGASVMGIVILLSKDLIRLIGLAFLIATPIAYHFMNQWLQNFAYRIDMEWWVFGLAGVLAIGIALLTVSLQSVRAALLSPVDSLRNE